MKSVTGFQTPKVKVEFISVTILKIYIESEGDCKMVEKFS